ncbi:hypothetical protein NQ315_017296 [Exocentrus adspersus]|uniref:ethanolamine kinase n=1 Tax=Exocentrus adspersus TaxID=1586481 RepID=A0AAV8VLB5_9CUCU|nr:hypothetical protein NQ315_017296 [Exocentrus adspersus]
MYDKDKVRNVPHVEVTVDEDDVETGALKILQTIRPEWHKDTVQFKLQVLDSALYSGMGLDLDYSLYPDKAFQTEWITAYLTEYNERPPTEEEVEDLYVQVNRFVLASHLFWAIWACIQAEHSYINFDYLGYAMVRFKEYFARKATCSILGRSS